MPVRSRRRRWVLVASLRELQQLFWRSLADEWDTIAPELVEAVLPSSTLDSSARVQVYAGAYSSRLLDVLHEDFPRLAALLGRDGFEQIARDYLRSHPSEHPSLRHLSRAMAAFLERRTDLPPYLADLARLEWARIDVFDAPDAEPLPVAALRTVRPEDWPHLYLVPIPALQVVRAAWPVHELWAGADPAGLIPAPTVIRVWRGAGYAVFHAAMDACAAEALRRLTAGAPFVVVCEAFADRPPGEAAEEVTSLLARWVEDGIIARVG